MEVIWNLIVIIIKNKIDTSIYKYNIFTDSYDGYPLKCKFIKCIIRPLFVDGDEVSLEECIDLDEHIEYIIAFIFETVNGFQIAPFDFKIKLYSARFYNGVKKYLLVNDIILKQSEDYYEDDNVELIHVWYFQW